MEWMMPTNRRKVLAIALVIVFAASHDAQAQDVQRVDVRDPGLVGHFYAASGASGRTGVLMGESRGAELALMIGSLRPDVAGVIAYSPSELRWGAVGGGAAAWTLHGLPLPYAQGHYDRAAPMREFTEILDGPADVRNAAA